MFTGDQVFPFFRGLIRIAFLQFLGSDKHDIFWQMFDCFRIFVPYLVLHMFDNFEDGAHGFFQGFRISLFFGDNFFPVPLVNVAGMEVIQFFVTPDCVHIGI